MSDVIIKEWNKAAAAYSKSQSSSPYALSCQKFVRWYLRDLEKAFVLDAGCGDGAYTRILAQNGGNVIGCDGSMGMLSIAREKFPEHRFDLVDITRKLPYSNSQFDLVFCNLVLMDIDPIDGALAEFGRVLRDGGILFVSIVHPAFYRAEWERDEAGLLISKKVSSYITASSEKQVLWGTTTHFHRPISFYVNKTVQAGFLLTEMLEPPTQAAGRMPDIPLYLFMRFVKGRV